MKWGITGRRTVSATGRRPFEAIWPGLCQPKPLIWLLFSNTMQSDSAEQLQPKKLFKKVKLYSNSLFFF